MTANPRSRSAPVARWLLRVQALCFAGAGLNHAHDIWQGGWLPYGWAPLTINIFWTALAVVDPVTAWLLLRRPRLGTIFALCVMVVDVGVNSYVKYSLGFGDWHGDLALQLQTWFLGFVIGSAVVT